MTTGDNAPARPAKTKADRIREWAAAERANREASPAQTSEPARRSPPFDAYWCPECGALLDSGLNPHGNPRCPTTVIHPVRVSLRGRKR